MAFCGISACATLKSARSWAHLERQAAKLERDEQKLLDLYLAEDVSMASVRPRLAELRQHRAHRLLTTTASELRAESGARGARD